MKLILPSNYEKNLKEASMEAGRHFVKEKLLEIAKAYYERAPLVKEWWIRILGKRDLYTNKINAMISGADKNNKWKLEIPIQGAQLWYVNMATNETRLEWILPLTAAKMAEKKESVTKDNLLLQQSYDNAAKWLGRDLITGKPVKS